ncbi:hypothetical protein [Desulfovibrio inopinatus]|uniref:hypothetical protein n=1 Tax=Desulfovibrio inopinatus TaxID=102109 RepID=UPI000489A24F|nr:hypothetical protein [Desulfovibrio inopinatus]
MDHNDHDTTINKEEYWFYHFVYHNMASLLSELDLAEEEETIDITPFNLQIEAKRFKKMAQKIRKLQEESTQLKAMIANQKESDALSMISIIVIGIIICIIIYNK